MMIPSTRRRGRPKNTCSECVKADIKMCSLGSIVPLNRGVEFGCYRPPYEGILRRKIVNFLSLN